MLGNMRTFLNTPIGDLGELDLRELLDELTHASGVDHRDLKAIPFVPFLIACSHPAGGGTARVPLHPLRTRPGLLETRIDKIESHSIQGLCGELTAAIHQSLEMHSNKKLMTLLNLVVRELDKKQRRPKPRR